MLLRLVCHARGRILGESGLETVVGDKLTTSRCDGTCVSVTITTHCFLPFKHAHVYYGPARAILLLFCLINLEMQLLFVPVQAQQGIHTIGS